MMSNRRRRSVSPVPRDGFIKVQRDIGKSRSCGVDGIGQSFVTLENFEPWARRSLSREIMRNHIAMPSSLA